MMVSLERGSPRLMMVSLEREPETDDGLQVYMTMSLVASFVLLSLVHHQPSPLAEAITCHWLFHSRPGWSHERI